jgi:hypothetical protein
MKQVKYREKGKKEFTTNSHVCIFFRVWIYPDIQVMNPLVGLIYPYCPGGRMNIFYPSYPNILKQDIFFLNPGHEDSIQRQWRWMMARRQQKTGGIEWKP